MAALTLYVHPARDASLRKLTLTEAAELQHTHLPHLAQDALLVTGAQDWETCHLPGLWQLPLFSNNQNLVSSCTKFTQLVKPPRPLNICDMTPFHTLENLHPPQQTT